MKTSSISLRVADFLKDYPPFSYLPQEDLQELAGTGRVKFHEQGEHIFDEGEPRGRYFFVVQQGTVNLTQRGPGGENELRDVRVEGDLLGIYWLMAEQPYRFTAITESDTLLYALSFESFLPIVSKNEKATRYLADYFSGRVSAEEPNGDANNPEDATTGSWLTQRGRHNLFGQTELLTCGTEKNIREVAIMLAKGQQQSVIVT
ncbi:MAG: cyclic nucleotide-binding domain-containing protein, partial [Verrucomicrobiota bacterium]